MSEHRFRFAQGEPVRVVFSGRVSQRRNNLRGPDTYIVELNDGDRTIYRKFSEHELAALPTAPEGSNVVRLDVAA